jgi:lysozyme
MACIKLSILDEQYKNGIRLSSQREDLTPIFCAKTERRDIVIRYIDPTGMSADEWDYDQQTKTLTWVSDKGGNTTQYVNTTKDGETTTTPINISTESAIRISEKSGVTVNTEKRPVDVSKLSISNKGLNFIKKEEGVRTEPYNDSKGNATIGVGHKIAGRAYNEQDKKDWAGFTVEKAMDLLRTDLAGTEGAIKSLVNVPLTQFQYDAIVSFTFNIGTNGLKGSEFLQELNNGNYNGDLMLNWSKPKAIVPRRTREVNLFKTGTY